MYSCWVDQLGEQRAREEGGAIVFGWDEKGEAAPGRVRRRREWKRGFERKGGRKEARGGGGNAGNVSVLLG
jgi:hypothetical protein